MAKNRRTRAEWINLIEQQKNSGLSQKEWCEKNGINPKAMSQMVRRIRKGTESTEKKPEWVEVVSIEKDRHVEPQTGSLFIEVCGYRLAAGTSYPAEKLVTVLRGLAGGC